MAKMRSSQGSSSIEAPKRRPSQSRQHRIIKGALSRSSGGGSDSNNSLSAVPEHDVDLDQVMPLAELVAAEEGNYQRLLEWNDRFENKANSVMNIATLLLGGLVALAFNLSIDFWRSKAAWLLFFLAAAPFLRVCYLIGQAQSPNLEPTEGEGVQDRPALSPTFFGTIAAMKPREFQACTTHNRTYRAHLADLTAQSYTNARILSAKFAKLAEAHRAMRVGYVLVVPCLAAVLAAVISEAAKDKHGGSIWDHIASYEKASAT